MQFILDFFVLITGIGAASGLSYKNGNLFIVSDNSNYLYEYQMDTKALDKHLLLDMGGKNEQVDKQSKVDLEAIAERGGIYYLVPSGSTPNRTMLFDIHPKDMSDIGKKNISTMYADLRKQLNIPVEDFNIEGALFYQDTLFLFNRGNGPHELNGVIKIPKDAPNTPPTFTPIKLPDIHGHAAGFTDAIVVENKIYYLAAAEGGSSTYHDGAVSGSQTGIINLADLRLEASATISSTHKFEGITLYQSTAEEYTFLLCEDSDDDGNQTDIYQLRVKK